MRRLFETEFNQSVVDISPRGGQRRPGEERVAHRSVLGASPPVELSRKRLSDIRFCDGSYIKE